MISCIIPASKRDAESQNLKDLIASIRAQDFPQDQIEILVVTEGDSEQAKAIGIRKAQGDICAMFCADNYLIPKTVFENVDYLFKIHPELTAAYSRYYACNSKDNSLNRYFSLIGNNDPIAFYLGKADRKPHYDQTDLPLDYELLCLKSGYTIPSFGDNGFYFKRSDLIKYANLNSYYPMDVAVDILRNKGYAFMARVIGIDTWHRTSDKLIPFLIKRYKYARDLYCDRTDRRWKMVGTREDYWKLAAFIFFTLTIAEPLLISFRGFLGRNSARFDPAWFWHWPVCFGFLITYTILAIRNLFKHGALFQKSQSLFPLSAVQPN